jgi:hypothetical protein
MRLEFRIGSRRFKGRGFELSQTAPILFLSYIAIILVFAETFLPSFDRFFTARNIGLFLMLFSFVFFIATYLGIFDFQRSMPPRPFVSSGEEVQTTLRELRNYIMHAKPTSTPPAQINIDEDFKNQVVARLVTESQTALSSFIEGEVFKKASEKVFKEDKFKILAGDIETVVDTYQADMGSWRRNANVNLMIGLICAVAGIAVMWQTLVSLPIDFDTSGVWKISDLYRFLARFGLVIIIESVAFFFLKLYREDRAMIRYFRNEITNLESKAAALKTALVFGSQADLSKILQSLVSTERNFLIKKGERIMTDITYENSEILMEKLFGRPELVERISKLAAGKKET